MLCGPPHASATQPSGTASGLPGATARSRGAWPAPGAWCSGRGPPAPWWRSTPRGMGPSACRPREASSSKWACRRTRVAGSSKARRTRPVLPAAAALSRRVARSGARSSAPWTSTRPAQMRRAGRSRSAAPPSSARAQAAASSGRGWVGRRRATSWRWSSSRRSPLPRAPAAASGSSPAAASRVSWACPGAAAWWQAHAAAPWASSAACVDTRR
mmetsp:Transcript_40755/g.117702  ORF Transcript_40755/g.117702 Transcript_40755/m.117702 type:complete len:214 (+) Transcript_40755:632-1273(+)